MMLQQIVLPLIALGAVSAAPPQAAEGEGTTQAERRLRACLSASAGDERAAFEEALLSARAACKRQIDDVRDMRIIAATAGLEPEAARVIDQRVARQLNNEIAHAVAHFTGLPVSHAQD